MELQTFSWPSPAPRQPGPWSPPAPRPLRGTAGLSLVIVNTGFRGSGCGELLGARRAAEREAEKFSRTLLHLDYQVQQDSRGDRPLPSPCPPSSSSPSPSRSSRGHVIAEGRQQHGRFFMSVTSSHGNEGLVLGCDARPHKRSCVFSVGNRPALA